MPGLGHNPVSNYRALLLHYKPDVVGPFVRDPPDAKLILCKVHLFSNLQGYIAVAFDAKNKYIYIQWSNMWNIHLKCVIPSSNYLGVGIFLEEPLYLIS